VGVSALVLALLAGAGLVPPRAAQAAEVAMAGDSSSESDTLAPAALPDRTDEVRASDAVDISAAETPDKKAPTPVKKAVSRSSSAATPGGWRSARVSWYGPGFYGKRMAGGGALLPSSMVVAHRTMKFGTKIEFKYKGRTVIAVVQDRGPYIAGRTFDLGPGTAQALGFGGVGTVQYRILGR
jgi:rare lipoprotein A (peptidoglycan hydrolase)